MALVDINILLIEVYCCKYTLVLPSSLQKGMSCQVLEGTKVQKKELGR